MLERSYYASTVETFQGLKDEYKLLETEYIFTSLQYAHHDLSWLNALFKYGYKIIIDISKKTLDDLNMSLEALYLKYPGMICRLDDGYDKEEILRFSKKYPVIINASTMSERFLKEIKKSNMIAAMFNYYPKPLTGMSEKDVKKITERLHRVNVPVYAFLSGTMSRRGPIHYGLPTLEIARGLNTLENYLQLKELTIDKIFLGDEYLTEKEVRELKHLNDGILKIEISTKYKGLFNYINTLKISCREDSSEYLHRFSHTRGKVGAFNINHLDRIENISKGDILIDGEEAARYKGELQIARKDAAAENYPFYKIGEVIDKNLIPYIKEEYTIQFEWEQPYVFSNKTH